MLQLRSGPRIATPNSDVTLVRSSRRGAVRANAASASQVAAGKLVAADKNKLGDSDLMVSGACAVVAHGRCCTLHPSARHK
jgi:hypothetical protein